LGGVRKIHQIQPYHLIYLKLHWIAVRNGFLCKFHSSFRPPQNNKHFISCKRIQLYIYWQHCSSYCKDLDQLNCSSRHLHYCIIKIFSERCSICQTYFYQDDHIKYSTDCLKPTMLRRNQSSLEHIAKENKEDKVYRLMINFYSYTVTLLYIAITIKWMFGSKNIGDYYSNRQSFLCQIFYST